jgi:hypothetical protein
MVCRDKIILSIPNIVCNSRGSKILSVEGAVCVAIMAIGEGVACGSTSVDSKTSQ